MENINENIDELIGKYLAGEASRDEAVMVESWASENDANERYLNHFRTIFHKAAQVQPLQHFNTDAAWNKVKANLKKPQGKKVTLEPDTVNFKWIWSVAASVVLLIAAGIYLFKDQSADGPAIIAKEVVAKKEAVSDSLPDGSDVFLNKETRVTYAYDHKKKLHRVKLEGEAYFNVNHSEEEKFIIEVGNIYIRDIGTSFNVKAYPGSNTVEVLVEEGEVIFYTDNNPGIHLKATGKGVYDKVTKTFGIDQPDPNILSYKTRMFVFSSTDLKTVAETLNHVYNKNIILGENISNCQLTVSFKDETIEEITQVIAATLGLTVTESEGNIVLEGKGCE